MYSLNLFRVISEIFAKAIFSRNLADAKQSEFSDEFSAGILRVSG